PMMRYMPNTTLRLAILGLSAFLMGDTANAVAIYQQNFDTATPNVNVSAANNGGGGGNTAFTSFSAPPAISALRPVVDSGELFGQGPTNQYFQVNDAGTGT